MIKAHDVFRFGKEQPAFGQQPEQTSKPGKGEEDGRIYSRHQRRQRQHKAQHHRNQAQRHGMPARQLETKFIRQKRTVGVANIQQPDGFFPKVNALLMVCCTTGARNRAK